MKIWSLICISVIVAVVRDITLNYVAVGMVIHQQVALCIPISTLLVTGRNLDHSVRLF